MREALWAALIGLSADEYMPYVFAAIARQVFPAAAHLGKCSLINESTVAIATYRPRPLLRCTYETFIILPPARRVSNTYGVAAAVSFSKISIWAPSRRRAVRVRRTPAGRSVLFFAARLISVAGLHHA